MDKLKCSDINIDGKGIVYDNDKLIYVDNLITDEEAKIHLTSKKHKFYLGKVVERFNDSPNREKIKCNICGGCDFYHLKYDFQLYLKTREVKRLYPSYNVNETIPSDDINFYRNKVQSPLRYKNDLLVRGMYLEGSQKFVKVNKCYLENEVLQKVIDNTLDVLNKNHFKEEIKTIYGRISNEGVMIALISLKKLSLSSELIKEIIQVSPNIISLINNVKNEDSNTILGEEEYLLYGKDYIVDTLLDKKFKISLHSFYQINKKQIEKLYKYAIDIAELQKDDVVLDCYSGIGTIGILASTYCRKVIGVEVVKSAVMNALDNLKMNNIDNVYYFLNDASKIFNNIDEQVDVCFLDPSRKGCSREFIEHLLRLKPKKIVYISCNVETQKRDIDLLLKDYELKIIQPFDLFPLTKHIECVVFLTIK